MSEEDRLREINGLLLDACFTALGCYTVMWGTVPEGWQKEIVDHLKSTLARAT